MRRILTLLVLLAIVAAAGWTLYRWRTPAAATTDPWRAVPAHSAVIIEVPDALRTWDAFTHTSQVYGTFERIPAMAAVGKLMARLVEQRENDPAFRTSVEHTPALIALMRSGSEGTGVLIAAAPSSREALPTLAQVLAIDPADAAELGQGAVITVRPDTALPALSLRISGGVLLLASSPAVLDEAALQMGRPSVVEQDTLLAQAIRTLGAGADAHVLVHTDRAEGLLHTWWSADALRDVALPGGWAALDLRTRPDALLLSGLMVPAGNDPQLRTVQEQGTGRLGVERVLPAAVGMLDAAHIHEPQSFLTARGVDDSLATAAGTLFHWVHGTVGTAAAYDDEGMPSWRWAVFQTDDAENAARTLSGTCAPATCDTSTYRGVRLSRLQANGAYERLLGPAFAPFVQPWWAVLGDVVVMSNEPATLHLSIDAWNDGGTLAEDKRTMGWFARISEESGRMVWCDVARAREAFSNGMRPDVRTAFDGWSALWDRFGGISLQVSPGQHGMQHLMIGLQHAPLESAATPGVLWNTAIGAEVTRKPDILLNHTNNTKEVLVQDVQHRVHLIGSTGKVQWVRALDGPIMGPVTQVDRFKNGKLQVLFNTEGHVYLIDRNGADVAGFPVKLPEKATAPLAAFDYDRTRDYRIVLPLADGTLRNLGVDGAAVTGWEAPKLAAPSGNTVRHLRIKNKDHLLVVDGKGNVLLLDRRGVERDKTPLELGENALVQRVVPGLELQATRLIWRDAAGAIQEGRLDGTRTTLASARPGTSWVIDLENDGTLEILRIAADSVIVTREGRPVLSRSFGTPVLASADLYALGKGAQRIGVVRPEIGKVGLLDDTGRELPALPLNGSVPASIADLNLDGGFELVTVLKDGHVVAYSLPLP